MPHRIPRVLILATCYLFGSGFSPCRAQGFIEHVEPPALEKGKTYKAPEVFAAEYLVPTPLPFSGDAKQHAKDIIAETQWLELMEGPGFIGAKMAETRTAWEWVAKTDGQALERLSATEKLRLIKLVIEKGVSPKASAMVQKICTWTSSEDQALIQKEVDLYPYFPEQQRPPWIKKHK